jgi:tetratricopeptide (TPR) repeat protein
MGERLIYHASVGFVIAVAYLLLAFVEKIPAVPVRKFSLTALLAVVVVLCGFATIARNPDWKNDDTLCSKDINTCPNSFLLNANVACMLVNKSDDERDGPVKTAHLQRSVALYTKVIGMQKNYVPGYMNRSAGYYKLNEPDNMLADLDTVYSIYPIHPQLPSMYYHAGILYLDKKEYGKAEMALQNSLKLNPNSGEARKALSYARQMQQAPQMK